jgi:uncharacterized protein YybS (DUF2232 family)
VDVNGGTVPPLDQSEGVPLPMALTRKDFFLGVTASLMAFLAVLLVPLAGIFAGIFTPLPTLLSIYRFGHPTGFWIPGSVLVLGVPLLYSLGAVGDLPYMLLMLIMGGLLGEGMRRQWSIEKTMGVAVGVALLLGTVTFWVVSGGFSPQFWSVLEEEMRQNVTALLQTYRGAGFGLDQQAALEAIPQTIPVFIRLLPGATLVSLLLVTWLNILVARRFCAVRRLPLPSWTPWSHWKAPEPLVWLVIATGCLLVLPSKGMALVGSNLLLGLSAVYLFQGLAVAVFYLHRWEVAPFLRAIIFALLLLQPFVTLLVMLVGLFDLWLNFRRLPSSGAQSNVPEAS